MALEEELKNLRVEEENGLRLFSDSVVTEENLVDVTEIFEKLRNSLQPDSIIKEPSFDLFEGTHSLEVNNKKLDTSLITLTRSEIEFDCNVAYGETEDEKLAYVTAIVDRLARYLVCWLNDYQLLPTTILSCRYVEYMLIESANIDKMVYLKTGNGLYDQVLCSAIYGICYFAKFVERLFKNGSVCPEEDLNFNSMGLDFLSYVCEPTQIKNLLQESSKLLRGFGESAENLLHLLELIRCLVSIEKCLTEYSADTTHLEELIIAARHLKEKSMSQTFVVPEGSFSMGIQKRLSNQSPPKNLVVPTQNYEGFILMAEDLSLVLSVNEANSIMEIMQFAKFFNKVTQRHVIARAVFFSFVIRHDETVLGRYSLSDFAQLHPLEFSLMSTEISKNLPDEMVPILQDVTNVLFDWYQNTSQNTSRYRQGYNRQLLLWDALQVQIENLEVEFESQMHDGQASDFPDEEGLLPYTSWTFAMKVTAMIEFVLKGFDLEVYKPFESYSMFWYAYYLAYQLESCLEKVHKFVEARINKIHSLNKKVKKQKAGEKKEALRARYRLLMETEMNQLKTNKRFLSFLFMECTVIKSLSLAQVFQFAILKSYKIMDNKSPTEGHFTTDHLLYDLRLKPFSSIGIPEVVPYSIMQSTLNDFMITEPMFALKLDKAMQCMHKELQNVSIAIENILQCITNDTDDGTLYGATRLVKPQAVDYFERLHKSAKLIQLNSKVIRAKLGDEPLSTPIIEKYRVKMRFSESSSTFFPLLDLVDKKR